MESVEYKKMRKFVEEIDNKISAHDPRLRRCIHIIHEDGSNIFLDSSFLLKYKNYIMVISEHYPPQFFDEEELLCYGQYERIYEVECMEDEG